MKRRYFVKSSFLVPAFAFDGSLRDSSFETQNKKNLKLSLNAYSFNKELRSGDTNLMELVDFCKHHRFEAIDPTGYYFPGYPNVPDDKFIFEFKRKAFISGIEISGTGVRNDFANADVQKRKDDLVLIEEWCQVASKLGAPLLRVFAGREAEDNRNKDDVMRQVVLDLKKACEIGEKYGVMMALQNHNEFLKSSEEIIQILTGVNSKWLGLHLDIGSLAFRNPYLEIQKLVQYAITWQIKEQVWENGKKVQVNYDRLVKIILDSDFEGYLPLETLNTDPTLQLPVMIEEMKKRL